jgi:hypothetical protein
MDTNLLLPRINLRQWILGDLRGVAGLLKAHNTDCGTTKEHSMSLNFILILCRTESIDWGISDLGLYNVCTVGSAPAFWWRVGVTLTDFVLPLWWRVSQATEIKSAIVFDGSNILVVCRLTLEAWTISMCLFCRCRHRGLVMGQSPYNVLGETS